MESSVLIVRLMHRFEGTDYIFIKKNIHLLPHFHPLFLWEVCRAMNNRRSYGSPKDQNLFIIKGENLLNQYILHREKEKDYQIS